MGRCFLPPPVFRERKGVMEKSRIVAAGIGILLIGVAAVWTAAIGRRTEKEAMEYRKLAEISGHSGTVAGFLIENSFRRPEPEREIHTDEERVTEAFYDWDALAGINRDIIGWLYLPNLVDMPVVGALDNQFYLSHDFSGKKSSSGCPFMDRDTEEGDFNRVIYGHNMGAGSEAMFSVLLRYEEEDYFRENGVLFYTDRYDRVTAYDVIAIVKYNVNDVGEWDFRVRNHGNREELLAWMAQLKERAFLYREPEQLPDRLITLATCDRRVYGKDGRFLVVGGN